VTVIKARLTSINIYPSDKVVTLLRDQSFSASANFDNGTHHPLLNSSIYWTVNNNNATIDASGKLTAIATGPVVVKASLKNNTLFQSQANVFVVEGNISAMNIDLEESTIAEGQSTRVSAKVDYDDGSSEDVTSQVAWLSSSPDVALVTRGYIRGLNVGTTEIKAVFRGVESTFKTLTVSNASLTSVQLTPNPLSLPKGGSEELELNAIYSDGSAIVWGRAEPRTPAVDRLINDSSNPVVDAATRNNIFGSEAQHAVIRQDGSIISWNSSGGILQTFTDPFEKVYPSHKAFAAIRLDGYVQAWGGMVSEVIIQVFKCQLNQKLDLGVHTDKSSY